MNSESYDKEEAIEIFTDLQEKSEKLNVDYLYILLKDEDDIVYAALSDYEDELADTEKAYFWYSLKEAEDDSFNETWDAFERKEPLFLESTDEWGSYRSVYLVEEASDGTKYIAGADITTSNLNNRVMTRVMQVMKIAPLALPLLILILFIEKEKEIIQEKIKKQLEKDKLTGVLNRKTGIETFKGLVKKGVELDVAIFDVRGINKVNESRGIERGDALIRIFATLLSNSIRKTDTIMRISGDKFIILLPKFPNSAEQNLLKNLEDNVKKFNLNNKNDFYLENDYFFKRYKGEDVNSFVEELFRNLIAKKKYTDQYDIQLVQEMFSSIEENNFQVHYQPKVNLKSESVSYEALIRWNHPERGLLFPGAFIETAEKSSVINKLTLFVLKEALKAAEILDTKISINISPISFGSEKFIEDTKALLDISDYSKLIIFEITEGVAINNLEATLDKMKEFFKYGIIFSIDDFGTGYSSLGYLEKLPIGEVKIDKTFVDNLDHKQVNPMLVKFICQLGRVLKLNIIIEGVESEEQVKEIMKLGGNIFQGYYFDKPHPIDIVLQNREMCIKKIKKIKNPIK